MAGMRVAFAVPALLALGLGPFRDRPFFEHRILDELLLHLFDQLFHRLGHARPAVTCR